MNFTEQDILDLKAKNGDDLTMVNIKGEGGQEATFILIVPSRKVMDLVANYGQKKDVFGANKSLIANCVVAGDLAIMEKDGGVYAALLNEIRKLMKTKEVEVKKL